MAGLTPVWPESTAAKNATVILSANRDPDNRQTWIIHRLKEAIGEARDRIQVQDIVTSAPVTKRLEEFYSATGPVKVMFFYQQHDGNSTGTATAEGEEVRQDALFLLDNQHPKLRGKCIYFIRRNTEGVERDTLQPDVDMTCGEIFSDTLQGFHFTLRHVYLPILEGKTQDWGRNTEASTKEYLAQARRFDDMIADAVSSLQGGIELKRPEKRYIVENKQQAYARAAADIEQLTAYESVMEDWCVHCERLLAESEQVDEDDNSGPDTEFEFWRNRMAKFNSVAEQQKQRDCKCVIGVVGHSRSKVFKRWKAIDTAITDSLNEAKDNVKFLSGLERYTEPLYSGKPEHVIDAMPSLMNNMKSMLTVARFYGTSMRMTTLFMKLTNQMITNCKNSLTCPDKPGLEESLWDQDVESLLSRLKMILKLHETYVQLYAQTKEKLSLQPKAKQFDFNEALIFGKFDQFVKRIGKLLDMFTTIHQFTSLAQHNVEGMDTLIQRFLDIMFEFKQKPYDLLDYSKNTFDRDYVEYNDNIAALELQVQSFINVSFENIVSTEQALTLLHQFEDILVRDSLKSDLDSKYGVIFHNYGQDLEAVLKLYEKHKAHPPVMRNAPPVTGNILWAKQLLNRIDEPMRKFRSHTTLMQNSKEAKRIIRMYNKVARALVEFETLWHSAWRKSIEAARSGLQATLIIRHPVTNKLFVNFDREILQLIRETKFLQRFKVEVPDSARMVLVQEDKFKSYFNQLSFALKEYERVTDLVPPIVKNLLLPHLNDLDSKLQPGMVLLSWQSMNIDSFLQRIHGGLSRFEELVRKISDILENRIEGNLKSISKTLLVELPTDQSFTLEQFVMLQEKTTKVKTMMLDRKNEEVERAVWDCVNLIQLFPLETSESVSRDEIHALWKHYSRLMYLSILRCTKQSFFSLKKRLASRTSGGFLYIERPFFDVDIELSLPVVTMNPSLDEIQGAINRCALNVLRCSKNIFQWSLTNANNTSNRTHRQSYHHLIGQDYQIVAVCLMLTGAVEGTKKHVHEYLKTFMKFDHLWKEDKQASYEAFLQANPGIEDFDQELQKFLDTERSINEIPPVHNIGCLSLETGPLKNSLRSEALQWKKQYTSNLHLDARRSLLALVEYMDETDALLDKEFKDLDDARQMMSVLKQVRDKETDMDMQITPVEKEYALLVKFDAHIEKEELDKVHNLPKSWKQVVRKAREASDNLNRRQDSFRTELLTNVSQFILEVRLFRQDFVENGPMEEGITPLQAADRMRKYKKLYMEKERKWRVYSEGEQLFGMPVTNYMELEVSRRELELLDKLYSLYIDVLTTMKEYKAIPWTDTGSQVETMKSQMAKFQDLCRKMPRQLREWDAFVELKTTIQDFSEVLPLLQLLVGTAMRPRHWAQVQALTGISLDPNSPELVLGDILKMDLHRRRAEVEDICNGAVDEQELEQRLETVRDDWAETRFEFQNFKSKGPVLLKAKELGEIMEKLEESMHALGNMTANRHAAPFKDQIHSWVTKLSAVSEVIEQWTHVQSMWVYMEAVFSAGDVAKQIPQEAKRFAGIDKSYMRLTSRAFEVPNVMLCCYGNDQMRTVLPHLADQLEMSQRSLTGYFETKRAQFPRFYFVSDGLLLKVLSQGSDPTMIVDHFKHVFGSLSNVTFGGEDAQVFINAMISGDGEHVALIKPLKVRGGVEEYLTELVGNMQATMKESTRECAFQCQTLENVATLAKDFPSQVCLLGLQIMTISQVEESIRTSKNDKDRVALVSVGKKVVQHNKDLISAMESASTSLERQVLEVMVTQFAHYRDVVDVLVKNKVRFGTDFDWVKQPRHYWNPETDECTISISDVSFTYDNEFQGCQEKLVVTPLTERCYNAIAQAVVTSYCSTLIGPAGTGKTETVKDMGRMLGKYCILFNCSAEMELKGLGKVFKGLAMAGCWGFFEGIHQLKAEVLSVAAQQLAYVLTAQRERKKQFIFTDGQNISLQPGCSCFLTMNPVHKDAKHLPENLKTHLRSISMHSPQTTAIVRVRLAAAGYSNDAHVAKKLEAFFSFCTAQLSRAQPYNFGMRTIDAVVRVASLQRRKSPGKVELNHLVSAIRMVNLPKLDAADIPIFLGLLEDIFGSEAANERVDVDFELQNAMVEAAASLHFEIDSVAAVKWKEKAVQCYELMSHHHALAVVGPVAAGKSAMLETVCRTSASLTGTKHSISRLNPKAVENHQIFGYMDPTTSEWTEGVLSSLWRKATNASSVHWIVFDGPVDPVWVENLNSVLDANKFLTLANGDRLPLATGMKIVLETEHVANATPATISRLLVICMGAHVLGWEVLVSSWLSVRKLKDTPLIQKAFDSALGTVMNVCGRLLKTVGNVQSICMLRHFLDLLQVPIAQAETGRNRIPSEVLERRIVFALYWAFGGALELEGKTRLETELKKLFPAAIPNPDLGKLLDCYLNSEGEWETFKSLVPKWEFPKLGAACSDLFVPNVHSVQYTYLMETMLPSAFPVLLTGPAGVGKTSISQEYLKSVPAESVAVRQLFMCSTTTAGTLQRSIESALEKKQGKTFGGTNGRVITFFIDDLSLPDYNKLGQQPTNELVRQLLSDKGFYNLDKAGEWKTIKDFRCVATMMAPGPGRNDIPSRLKRHWLIFSVPMPSKAALESTFTAIIKGSFSDQVVSTDICTSAVKTVDATIQIWSRLQQTASPAFATFYYGYTLRDLSRAFIGLTRMSPDRIENREHFLRLWVHECDHVFLDKLATKAEAMHAQPIIGQALEETFGQKVAHKLAQQQIFFSPLMLPEDEQEELEDDATEREMFLAAPYQVNLQMKKVTERVEELRARPDLAKHAQGIILFPHAVENILKIGRVISLPFGSCVLLGPRGSGKQSLARLTSVFVGHETMRVACSRGSEVAELMLDLKIASKMAGVEGKNLTLMLPDEEQRDETLYGLVNQLLLTGEVPSLFSRDEMESILADPAFRRTANRQLKGAAPTHENLQALFAARVRSLVHVVMTFSDTGLEFSRQSRRFPAIMACCYLLAFHAWPDEALYKVAEMRLKEVKPAIKEKETLIQHMITQHHLIESTAAESSHPPERLVPVTPKNYVVYLEHFVEAYVDNYERTKQRNDKLNLVLLKLSDAVQDMEDMSVEITESEEVLQAASGESATMLKEISALASQCERKRRDVQNVESEINGIEKMMKSEQDELQRLLEPINPIMDEADTVLDNISARDLQGVKAIRTPPAVIRVIFDAVLLLRQRPMNKIQVTEEKGVAMYKDSFQLGHQLLLEPTFIESLHQFQRDIITEETIELLQPYLDHPLFSVEVARKASGLSAGLCSWVKAVVEYHEAIRDLRPRMDNLHAKKMELGRAEKRREAAHKDLASVQSDIDNLQRQHEEAFREKQRLQEETESTKTRLSTATALVAALTNERRDWEFESQQYQNKLAVVAGNACLVAAFLAYCGPLGHATRSQILTAQVREDLKRRDIPVAAGDVTELIVKPGEKGEWQIQGLPNDVLSMQNGVLVTRALRYPLLIDPQGQGCKWVKNKEGSSQAGREAAGGEAGVRVVHAADKQLRNILEDCMAYGWALVVEHADEEVEALVEPILRLPRKPQHRRMSLVAISQPSMRSERQRSTQVEMADGRTVSCSDRFMLYLTAPELSAKLRRRMFAQLTVVAFDMTPSGLEEQLLSLVLEHERPDLQVQRQRVMEEGHALQKSLLRYEEELVTRLFTTSGNLMEDGAVVDALASTKQAHTLSEEKLRASKESQERVGTNCEEYRAVAQRGSLLFFLASGMRKISSMYQTSLATLLHLYWSALARTPQESVVGFRVKEIVDELTLLVFRHVKRGLLAEDADVFSLLLALRVNLEEEVITEEHLNCFLKGAFSVNPETVRRKPYNWIPEASWLNCVQLFHSVHTFRDLPDSIQHFGEQWRYWHASESPELHKIPDIPSASERMDRFALLLLVRALRPDRIHFVARDYVVSVLGEKFVEVMPFNLDAAVADSSEKEPIVCILSPATDPTEQILVHAKKLKREVLVVSMGQEQEAVARRHLDTGISIGCWVLLQNAHLSLQFVSDLEHSMGKMEAIEADFRLWITTEPHPAFPIGVLQMSLKLTTEAPVGVKERMRRIYAGVTQDMLDEVGRGEWRALLFSLALMHCILLERSKFGPLGWSAPYEFGQAELQGAMRSLRGMMVDLEQKKIKEVSWPAVRFNIGEVLYGSSLSSDADRRLMMTLTDKHFSPALLETTFTFLSQHPVPVGQDVSVYRASIESLPDMESPDLLGLTVFDDHGRNLTLSSRLLGGMATCIDAEGASPALEALKETVVAAQVSELLTMMPPTFSQSDGKEGFAKEGGTAPLNVALRNELDCLNRVNNAARNSLNAILFALSGAATLAPAMQPELEQVRRGQTPEAWLALSWDTPGLGLWLESMQQRYEQWRRWLDRGRPICFWLGGFMRPRTFLFAVMQDASRKHKTWSLDDIVLVTEVTKVEAGELKGPPENGVYVNGLSLEGCMWNRTTGALAESTLKKSLQQSIGAALPVVYICPVAQAMRKYEHNVYECPLYASRLRSEHSLITTLDLKTEDSGAKWALRGAAAFTASKALSPSFTHGSRTQASVDPEPSLGVPPP